MIATAIFAEGGAGLISGNVQTLKSHLFALLVVIGYTAVMSYIGFAVIRKFAGLLVSPEEELAGLDLVQLGETAGESYSLEPLTPQNLSV